MGFPNKPVGFPKNDHFGVEIGGTTIKRKHPHGSCICPAGHRSFPGGFVKSVRVLCVLGGFGRLKFPAEDRNIICTIILLLDVSKGMFQVVIPLILW